MDRPTSIGGHKRTGSAIAPRKGSVIPSHSNGASHDSTAAARPSTSSGTGAISLFVTNLRLLDFDLLPDWPGITVASLGNQDARTRIRGTEFALFQLFKLYDPMTTAEKLQPFFPPLEPLQSINLRAAIFRCLSDLKKNGVIAKDAVIRKSMLDECQGDKFWEICLVFSSIVMKKITLNMRTPYGTPLAEHLATAESLSRVDKDCMLPLSLAHRKSLGKLLETKQRKTEILGKLHRVLAEKSIDMQRRKARAQEESRKRSAPNSIEKARNVEQNLRKNWIGANGNLRETMIYGDDTSHQDTILAVPFEDVWAAESPLTFSNVQQEPGLLQGLEHRVNCQSQRLRKWQNIHEKMLSSKPKNARYSMLAPPSASVPLQFDRHRNLSAQDPPEMDDGPPEIKKNPNTSQYDDILTAMREELRQNRLRPKPEVPPLIHRANTTPVDPARKMDMQVDTNVARVEHPRSPSLTAVPFRPMFGRRVPSRSRSYQQPKLESQRQPIPLKSELFSPLKAAARASPVSNSDAGSYVSSPLQQDPQSPGSPGVAESPYDRKRVSQSSEAEGTVDSGVGLGMDEALATPRARPSSTSSDSFATLSLVERTRKSVAFTGSDQINGFLPDSRVPESKPEPTKPVSRTAPMEAIPCALNRNGSLLERTRQSISLAPAPSHAGPMSRKQHSPTRSYPVNQFETPQKPQPRDFTPQETLFSPDAEYESVFKSRPKIRVASPHIDSKRVGLEGYNRS